MSSPTVHTVSILWLLVAGLFSLVVALIAGILKSSVDARLAEAVLYGGTAFAASMGVALPILVVLNLM
ncbi:hypothetical protein [Micromonospora sp. NPDC005710]|uniref:hypothetical protein n=1 Tax=Micromonospora sp. NPDC005710 TaxID=3157051 RepID=UPI0034015B27